MMYTLTIFLLISIALAYFGPGDAARSAAAWKRAAGLVALTLAVGCGDPLVGRHRLSLGGVASALTPDGRREPVVLPPDLELTVERSGDGYRVDLLGCSLLATREGATAQLVAGQRCSLTVGQQTFEVVDIAGQVDERSDTRVALTVTAEGAKDPAGTPVSAFWLVAPAAAAATGH